MLVLLAVIVVNMHAGDEFAQRRKAFLDALLLWAVGNMRVADIEIEAQAGQARFVVKGAEIRRIAHLAGSVLDADVYTDMLGMQHQVLERTERGVALARVSGLAGAAHVKDHARE